MTAQKDGIRFENSLTNDVANKTNNSVRVVQGGGSSGNLSTDQPDLLFLRETGGNVVVSAAECKRTTRDRFYIDKEDMDQLKAFCGRFISPVLIVKFTHRQTLVVELPKGNHRDLVQDFANDIPAAFDPHVTSSGKLRLSKPDTTDWPSSQAGKKDYEIVIETLRL